MSTKTTPAVEALAGETTCANGLFDQPWWLDAVAPGAWDEVRIEEKGGTLARLPYLRTERLGLVSLVQPALTKTLGPWTRPSSGKRVRQLSTEMDLMGRLIAELPPYDRFHQQFSPLVTNWMPFMWAGFQATVAYTYRLEDIRDPEKVKADFHTSRRRAISKAEDQVEIRDDLGIDLFVELNKKAFRRRGTEPPYSDDFVRRLHAACTARGQFHLLFAVDAQGRLRAAEFSAWHGDTTYGLMAAFDPELPDVGAPSLLVWHAIMVAAEHGSIMDFGGSTMPGIEPFIRGFGGRPVPYLIVSRTNRKARAFSAGGEIAGGIAGRLGKVRRTVSGRRQTTSGRAAPA
jgi:hypothetical protein